MALSVLRGVIILAAFVFFAGPIDAAPTPIFAGHLNSLSSNASDFQKQTETQKLQVNLQSASLKQTDRCVGEQKELIAC